MLSFRLDFALCLRSGGLIAAASIFLADGALDHVLITSMHWRVTSVLAVVNAMMQHGVETPFISYSCDSLMLLKVKGDA